jgi:hypothetical protein
VGVLQSPDEQPNRAEVRADKQLFQSELPPGPHNNLVDDVNSDSLTILSAFVGKSVAAASPGEKIQFVRSGFYTVDNGCTADKLVFNLTVELKGESKKRVDGAMSRRSVFSRKNLARHPQWQGSHSWSIL